ncbi:hypothetical protein [Pararhizobium sp.]|uniref:hypothetical protein n=1 Tax=Pararhizobium sp. TaxID=1977563 RepID=UPI002727F320|nr:hypothetical protein [Pararhizobium sp.]MDO9415446.1 hypothetical protein [Pararhizobium sp.]
MRSTGSSSAGPVLAAVACLLLGAGGAFGYLTLTRPDLRPEVETLTSQLTGVTTERDKLVKDIAAFRANSGSWAEELEKELAQLKLEELPKLNRLLDSRDTALEEMNGKLKDAETSRTEAEAEATKLRSEVETIRSTEIPKITEEAKQAESASAAREEALKKQSADTLAAAVKAADDARAGLEAQLTTATTRAADLEKRLASALQGASGADIAAGLQTELKAATDKAATLEKQVASLTVELQAAKAAAISQVSQPNEKPAEKLTEQPVKSRSPSNAVRASAVVEDALDRTVGLQGLAQADRQVLHDKLVAGECVVPALDAVFDRVPPLVLRNLMRDLRSDC